ncbi:hypothetical protein KUH03_21215 [Sphingobacterium sp. E70]|uniref:hypothetical protein n=1 Tax=Sphingobacterium sp. E70 TaxID=2853439 RepID=UPI00211CD5DB|nr:hypothetical protein [Sphingobacterium sp. E70]ULT28762.1 hypothetical protein KUH03_21215 [Sphingobacterium sp. E70]
MGRTSLIYQSENRIYQNPAQEIPLVLPQYTPAEVIERTRSYIDQEKSKIRSFIDGHFFYLDSNNHAHAAFMLHQAIELSLRTAEKLLLNDERKSHSLRGTIAHLKTFDAKLAKLIDSEEEKKHLKRLMRPMLVIVTIKIIRSTKVY